MYREKYLKAEHDSCKGKVFLNILCNKYNFILEIGGERIIEFILLTSYFIKVKIKLVYK